MPDSQRQKFLSKVIEINIDGYSEHWEYETANIGESKMYVTYKLKKTGRYPTGV